MGQSCLFGCGADTGTRFAVATRCDIFLNDASCLCAFGDCLQLFHALYSHLPVVLQLLSAKADMQYRDPSDFGTHV